MQPLRIRIDRIVDFGTIVSLVGFDIDTRKPVTDPRRSPAIRRVLGSMARSRFARSRSSTPPTG